MEYIGLTEDEMLDVIIEAENGMQNDKEALRKRLRSLAMRDEEIEKRMAHFESTYLLRKLIAENNRRISESLDEVDVKKKDLFLYQQLHFLLRIHVHAPVIILVG